MTQINIQIQTDTPTCTIAEFCRRSGMKQRLVQQKIAAGLIPIMPKEKRLEKPMINMVAYTAMCAEVNATRTHRTA